MSTNLKEHVEVANLRQPILISAFSSGQKGGSTATAALTYLMSQWDAKLVAELESDDYYNYARTRPTVRRVEDKSVIDWPTNLIYQLTPPEGERDLLLLVGTEPSMRWRPFAQELADYIERAGVTDAVSMRSLPAPVSHRNSTAVQAVYSDNATADDFGVPPTIFTEGPLDIGAFLSLELKERNIRTVDLLALEPYYTTTLPDTKAGLALLEAVGAGFDLQIPADALQPAIEAQLSGIEQAVDASEEVRELVQELEERTRSIETRQQRRALPEANKVPFELNVEDVLGDVEALLFGKGNGA